MTHQERLTRATAAENALREFIRPAFETIEREYTERLIELAAESPFGWFWRAPTRWQIAKLSIARKIARVVLAQIEALTLDAQAAEASMDRATQIGKISDHKRRILGL